MCGSPHSPAAWGFPIHLKRIYLEAAKTENTTGQFSNYLDLNQSPLAWESRLSTIITKCNPHLFIFKLFMYDSYTSIIPFFSADRSDEKLHRRSTVRMGIRVVQMPSGTEDMPEVEGTPPHAAAEKQFILSDGKLKLEASLNKSVYHHGDPVIVSVAVHNNSNKTVRRLKVNTQQNIIS